LQDLRCPAWASGKLIAGPALSIPLIARTYSRTVDRMRADRRI
jgi:hypothetical protein